MKTSAGLTLIELMIVVAVLAIISAIALPAYRGYISTSHRAECQTEAAAIKLAEEEYFLQNSSYFPPTPFGNSHTAADLELKSGNLYKHAPENYVNCDYSVTTASATGYRLIVTGAGALNGAGTIVDYSKN